MLNVIDAVLEHSGSLDSDSECEAGVLVAVDSAVLENLLVYNARTENLNPACALAKLTAAAVLCACSAAREA